MTEEQAVAFTKEICRMYFEERNHDKLMDYISKDIVWIGVRGKKGFNTFGNLQEYLRIGKEVYSGSVHLDNQEACVLEITKDLTCVLACMDVYTPPEEGPVFTEHIHITIIYRREGQ